MSEVRAVGDSSSLMGDLADVPLQDSKPQVLELRNLALALALASAAAL